jgi:hypothetical protein
MDWNKENTMSLRSIDVVTISEARARLNELAEESWSTELKNC